MIIGSGGREHALGWKLSQSPDCGQLYFAPGSGGTAALGENTGIPVTDVTALADFAAQHACFTVIGPELPLSLGCADVFRARGLRVFGPDKRAAMLESSKAYAKEFMQKYDIPTAAYAAFDSPEAALAAVEKHPYPLWIKADGLAAGKGAVFCADVHDARQTVSAMMRDKTFGEAGERIVLEEHLEGRELTLLCFTDGRTLLPMESARDYKRIYDQDEGPNTGGMGSISPVPGYTTECCGQIAERTLTGIQNEGLDFRGVVYIGLMLTSKGPKVIEYNARFGDPETEALLPRLETDLFSVLQAAEARLLHTITLKWKPETAVCVMLSSGGYPGVYTTGHAIEGLDNGGMSVPGAGAVVFHAGTSLNGDTIVTDGGRVLAVTALGRDADDARQNVYTAVERIHFKDRHYRKDIGL